MSSSLTNKKSILTSILPQDYEDYFNIINFDLILITFKN